MGNSENNSVCPAIVEGVATNINNNSTVTCQPMIINQSASMVNYTCSVSQNQAYDAMVTVCPTANSTDCKTATANFCELECGYKNQLLSVVIATYLVRLKECSSVGETVCLSLEFATNVDLSVQELVVTFTNINSSEPSWNATLFGENDTSRGTGHFYCCCT